jgi:transcriptional regulator with XRE-family HTH domain
MKSMFTPKEKYRMKQIFLYIYSNGTPPTCECGCGIHVKFDMSGKPRRYVNKHWHKSEDVLKANFERTKDNVPIEKFRELVYKLKQQKNLSFKELAEMARISPGQLNHLMYGDDVRSVSKDWLTLFLKRISGMPAPPTSYVLNNLKTLSKRDKILEKEFNENLGRSVLLDSTTSL